MWIKGPGAIMKVSAREDRGERQSRPFNKPAACYAVRLLCERRRLLTARQNLRQPAVVLAAAAAAAAAAGCLHPTTATQSWMRDQGAQAAEPEAVA